MLTNLRLAFRSLVKSPGFTLTAIATMALCLGANLTIFAVVDAILLRALPFPEPDRLVSVLNAYPAAGVERSSASIANYFDRRGAVAAFSSIALIQEGSLIVGTAGSPNRVPMARVTPEFFATLGVPLARGRSFTDAELTYQTDPVAILTDEFWRSHFAADLDVLGRTFLNDGLTITVVGVLKPGFRYLASPAKFFRPASHHPEERQPASRHNNNWNMIARLAPGVTVAAAQEQMNAFTTQILASDPFAQQVRDAGFRTTIATLHSDFVRTIKPTLLLLQVGVAFLLLIGVVNMTNLMLIRASGRTKELAVRQALGAGRRHVAAEVAVETTLLTLAGGILGLLLGSFGIDLLRSLATDQLLLGPAIVFDARLAVFSLAAAVVVGVVLAVPIIWFNLHTRLAASLQTETRSGTTTRAAQRLRHAFIVAQIALAFVLLSSAGLLGLSLRRVLATPSGFSSKNVLTGQIALPWVNYKTAPDQQAFVERLLPVLRALPGVTSVATTTGLPFTPTTNDSVVFVEGYINSTDTPLHAHYLSWVSAQYWTTMKIPLLRGRLFEEADSHRETKVCIIDQPFAERYWPGVDPIGRRFAINGAFSEETAVTVVGLVAEVKQSELAEKSGHGAAYFPQSGQSSFSVLVRTALPPESLAQAVRKSVLQLDAGLPVDDLRPMQARIDDSLVVRRSPAILASIFATVALLLAAIGTYGVLAYSVGQRRREIGVRMALGAVPQQVLAQFLGLGARLLFTGLVLGILGAWVAGLAMQSLLFGVGSLNIIVLFATAGVLLSVVFVALLLPALRAARTDPMVALRAE